MGIVTVVHGGEGRAKARVGDLLQESRSADFGHGTTGTDDDTGCGISWCDIYWQDGIDSHPIKWWTLGERAFQMAPTTMRNDPT